MRLTSRPDDADVIRARLRALLEDRDRASGWIPDEPDEDPVPSPVADDPPDPDPAAPDPAEPVPLEGSGRHRTPGAAARWSPGRTGARALWLAAIFAALVLVGWTWWDRPTVEPVGPVDVGSAASPGLSSTPASPSVGEVAETSTALVVSVVGTVAHPGLVTLPAGSRVADAIAAAGGLLPKADPATVNLAAVVSDGQQIAVGAPGAVAAAPASGSASGPPSAAGGKVDLNTATVADLDALPGIGPVLAQRIVDYRAQHGPFRTVDDLDDVPGIGPAIFGELADLVVAAGG